MILRPLNIMTSPGRRGATSVILVAATCALAVFSAAAQTTNLNRFGFNGPEVFPIDNQISQLRVADLDGDGLNDLLVVNNARSKIDLLYNQTGKTNLTRNAVTMKRELNE